LGKPFREIGLKKIIDNGIDDDRNGYIDDVHGWNFRATKDGTIVENEQMGATQLNVAWKKKYENVNVASLNQNEKKDLNSYI
jgi:cell wall-associated protease